MPATTDMRYGRDRRTASPPKPTPNWREAFEQALGGGGISGNCGTCSFCVKAGVRNTAEKYKCVECPFSCKESRACAVPCWDVFCNGMDNSDRRTICRYVLEHGGDVIDYDEARLLIGTALTILGKDEAREKFLWKAEPEKAEWVAATWGEGNLRLASTVAGNVWVRNDDMRFLIYRNNEMSGAFIAVSDEELRDRVREFLNGIEQQ